MASKYLPGSREPQLVHHTLDWVAKLAVARYERDRKEGKDTNQNPFAPGSIQFTAYQKRLMGHTQ